LLDIAVDLEAGAALVDVDLEIDVGKHRIKSLRQHRGKHVEHGGAGIGVLAGHDAQDGVALVRRGALVDDRKRLAVAHMDRSGPAEDARQAQPVELHIAMVTLVDLDADDGAAMAVRRQGIELAGTAIGTVAVGKFASMQGPIGCHDDLHFRGGLEFSADPCLVKRQRRARSREVRKEMGRTEAQGTQRVPYGLEQVVALGDGCASRDTRHG